MVFESRNGRRLPPPPPYSAHDLHTRLNEAAPLLSTDYSTVLTVYPVNYPCDDGTQAHEIVAALAALAIHLNPTHDSSMREWTSSQSGCLTLGVSTTVKDPVFIYHLTIMPVSKPSSF